MKLLIKLMLLTTLLFSSAIFAQEAHPYTAKAPKLDKQKIEALLANPEKLVVVDVRRPDELTAIGGFPVYLSIQSKDLEKYLAYIPKDRQLVTVSNHAGRAGKSADLLADKGFNVVGAIGVQDYEAEGGVLTKIPVPAPKP
jgi:rhodanese-related sulfurtransferase